MSPHRAQLPNVRVVGANHYERFYRAQKIDRLVAEIDATAERAGIKPHAQAGLVLSRVIDLLDEHGWMRLASDARCIAPSAETIAAVRRVYERRAERGVES
jgi:hypothetical protein